MRFSPVSPCLHLEVEGGPEQLGLTIYGDVDGVDSFVARVRVTEYSGEIRFAGPCDDDRVPADGQTTVEATYIPPSTGTHQPLVPPLKWRLSDNEPVSCSDPLWVRKR